MARLTDHTRILVAKAYATGDLDELRTLALAAIDALDEATDAYDSMAVSA